MSFKRILIVVDLDSDADVITALARRLGANTTIAFSVLGVVPDFPAPTFKNDKASKTARDLAEKLVDALREKVDQIAAALPHDTPNNIVSGRLVEEVSKAVVIHHADIVLKTSSVLPGERGPLFGSIDKRLIRNCPAPVWVVRPDIGEAFDRIAVAVDRYDIHPDAKGHFDLSLQLLDHAVGLATAFGIDRVDVVHSWDAVGADLARSARSGLTPQEAEEYMTEFEQDSAAWLAGFIEEANERLGNPAVKLVPRLVFGRPRHVLVNKVGELGADVLILGTIARSGALGLLIGNTAEDILDRVECSVLAVKPAVKNV